MTTAGTVLFSRSDVEKPPEPRKVRATTAGAVAWRFRDAERGAPTSAVRSSPVPYGTLQIFCSLPRSSGAGGGRGRELPEGAKKP